jgi:hypothetical protein
VSAVHALSGAEATAICRLLECQCIPVRIAVDEAQTVHIWARRTVTTREEVTALAAVIAWTDARVAWHGAVA